MLFLNLQALHQIDPSSLASSLCASGRHLNVYLPLLSVYTSRSTWRFEAELGLHNLVTEQQQQQQHQLQQQQQEQQEDVGGSQLSLSSPFAAAAPATFSTQQQQQSSGDAASFSKSSASEFQLPDVGALETDQSASVDMSGLAAAPRTSSTAAAAAAAATVAAASRQSSGHGSKVSSSRARLLKELLNKSGFSIIC